MWEPATGVSVCPRCLSVQEEKDGHLVVETAVLCKNLFTLELLAVTYTVMEEMKSVFFFFF